jgi:hypothetical protein
MPGPLLRGGRPGISPQPSSRLDVSSGDCDIGSVTRTSTPLPMERLRHPFLSGVLCLVFGVLFLVAGVVGLVRGVWPPGPFGGLRAYLGVLVACFFFSFAGVRSLLEARARRRMRVSQEQDRAGLPGQARPWWL